MTDKGAVEKFPESRATEITSIGAQATIGALPIVGGSAAPIIAALVTGPLERRRTAWFNRIADGLRELEQRLDGFNPAELADNEEFASAVYEISDAAMKTSNEAKRERLANVVLNIAAGRSIQDVLRGKFTTLVQTFAEEHILLLKVCHSPASFPRIAEKARHMMASPLAIYEDELRFHGISPEVTDLVLKELDSEGLMTNTLKGMATGSAALQPSTSQTGDAFLKFIASPFET